MSGFVYVATNPYLSTVCKVGMTHRPVNRRMSDLGRNIPGQFTAYMIVLCDEPIEVEEEADNQLENLRVRCGKEYYFCSAEYASIIVLSAFSVVSGRAAKSHEISYSGTFELEGVE